MTNIAIRDRGYDLALPDTDTLKNELEAVRAFQTQVKKLLIEGHDYGVIPGTDKPTLFQPGAEKMDKILHLADSYDIEVRQEDWTKPFFYYLIKCKLNIIGTNVQVAEGLGSCNSMEDRYRYRWVFQSQLPNDLQGDAGKAERDRFSSKTINTKNGTARQYRVENDNIFSLVNTLLKMARKRAHIAASLSAGRLSDVFTQDMEDIAEVVTSAGNEPAPGEISTEHFCQIHRVPFFKKGRMKEYAHPIDGTQPVQWCNEPPTTTQALSSERGESLTQPVASPEKENPIVPPIIDETWLGDSLKTLQWADVGGWLKAHYKVTGKNVREMVAALTIEQAKDFVGEINTRLEMK